MMSQKITTSQNLFNFAPVGKTYAELNAFIKSNKAGYEKFEEIAEELYYRTTLGTAAEIKAESKKTDVANFKRELPCFIVASDSRAKGGNVLPHIQIDIDGLHKHNAEALRDHLAEKLGDHLLFCALGPSSLSVKAVLVIDAVVEWGSYKDFSAHVIADVLEGVNIYGGLLDYFAPNQVSFVPNPNGAFFNDNPVPYHTKKYANIANKKAASVVTKASNPQIDSTPILTNKQAEIAALAVYNESIKPLKKVDTLTLGKACAALKGKGVTPAQAVEFLAPLTSNLGENMQKDGKFFVKTYPNFCKNQTTTEFGGFTKFGNTEVETATVNQYLGEAELQIVNFITKYNSAAIQAPTGTGKTYTIPKLASRFAEKVVFVVATTSVLEQTPTEFARYYELEKSIDAPIIATTYNSLGNCLNELARIGYNESDIVMVADEAHNFVASGLPSYGAAYVKFGQFKKSILVSATMLLNESYKFRDLPILKIEKNKVAEKHVTIFEYKKNRLQLAILAAFEDFKSGQPTIVALNNKNGDLETAKLMAAEAGVKIAPFNADTKHTDVIKTMLAESKLPQNELVFMTSAGFEGFNEKTVAKCANVHIIDVSHVATGELDVIQLAGRFRNAETINVKWHKAASTSTKVYDAIFDLNKREVDEEFLAEFDELLKTDDAAASKTANSLRVLREKSPACARYLAFQNGQIILDERMAAHNAHMELRRLASKSSAHAKFHLEYYGFFVEIIEVADEDSAEVQSYKEELESIRAEQKAEVAKYVGELCDEMAAAEAGTEIKNLKKILRKSGEKTKKMAAKLILETRNFVSDKEVFVKLGGMAASETALDKVISTAKNFNMAKTDKRSVLFKMRECVAGFGIGYDFTMEEIIKIYSHFFKEKAKIATEKQLEQLSLEMFGLIVELAPSKRKKVGAKQVRFRELLSLNPFGFDFN